MVNLSSYRFFYLWLLLQYYTVSTFVICYSNECFIFCHHGEKTLTLYILRVIWNSWELLGLVRLSQIFYGVLSFSFT